MMAVVKGRRGLIFMVLRALEWLLGFQNVCSIIEVIVQSKMTVLSFIHFMIHDLLLWDTKEYMYNLYANPVVISN